MHDACILGGNGALVSFSGRSDDQDLCHGRDRTCPCDLYLGPVFIAFEQSVDRFM